MYESVSINTCLYLSFCECCCRLTSRAGTICSMWRGSQMFTCNSSSTVFLTTPCSPRIPDTRILNTHKLHKFTHKHTKYTFISRLWSWVLFCCLFYETVHNFGVFLWYRENRAPCIINTIQQFADIKKSLTYEKA